MPALRLVIHADVDVLLACRKDLFLLLSLEAWQLVYRLPNYLQGSCDLFLGYDKRRSQANDVLVSWFCLFK